MNHRDLGIVALVMAVASLVVGGLSFLTPETADAGIAFLAVGVVLAAIGAWGVSRGPSRPGRSQSPAGAADPPRDQRPKSKLSQILDGLTGFNG